MRQVSNLLYCSKFLYDLQIVSSLPSKAYSDYPFLVIGDFFSKDECEGILAHIKSADEYEKAKIKSTVAIDLILPLIDQAIRKTDIYSLTLSQNEHFELRLDSFRPQIEKFFNVSLLGASDAQVLSYGKGDFYVRHADDSSEIIDEDGMAVDYKQVAPHRVITTVLFLNSGGDDFDGGELVFSHLTDIDGAPFCLKPKQGFMVVFPSNPYFAHEVLKVTNGHRATLVKWHDAIVH
jgi:SM-20-related protein